MQHLNQGVEMAERETGAPGTFTERVTDAGGGHVVAMVRLGRPSGNARPSPRRPLSEVAV